MKYLPIIIQDFLNQMFRIKKVYKCVAYITEMNFSATFLDSEKNKSNDKIVEAFEIIEYSEMRAYNEAYDVLKLKYPGMGFDIRISKK